MSWYENTVAFFLFSMECYHIIGHLNVLFRVRLLPRKDLTRLRFYFLVDTLTVFTSSILFLQKLQWLAYIQIVQHLYYFLLWDQTFLAKKIISWSSIDWVQSSLNSEWHWDSILGTLFDVAVHACMAYCLIPYLTTVQIIIGLVLVHSVLLPVLCGPWYAWSNPYSPPKWVEKRLQPVSY